jgi:hypothetical protein
MQPWTTVLSYLPQVPDISVLPEPRQMKAFYAGRELLYGRIVDDGLVKHIEQGMLEFRIANEGWMAAFEYDRATKQVSVLVFPIGHARKVTLRVYNRSETLL